MHYASVLTLNVNAGRFKIAVQVIHPHIKTYRTKAVRLLFYN